MYSKTVTGKSTKSSLAELRSALDQAGAVFIGAGAGLSASAGFAYSGPRFRQYFSDFEEKYGFRDMYTGGFTRFASPEEQWAYWSRMIFLNRYCPPPKPVYQNLRKLVGDNDYFVLTTNVDHCFQKAGFEKARLFYTQGDYGLWQCSRPCHQKTYDNETAVRQMLEAQGFTIQENGGLTVPLGTVPKRTVPTELVPRCPKCGATMTMNLRCDAAFVEDDGWHAAAARDQGFALRGDFGLPVFNSQAIKELKRVGFASCTASFELKLAQIRDLSKLIDLEVVVYGRLPLMITENCILKNRDGGCKRSCEGQNRLLVDRKGERFPVLRAPGCRNEIFNAKRLYLADKANDYRRVGAWGARLSFTTESAQECLHIARQYLGQERPTLDDITRGLYYRDVE